MAFPTVPTVAGSKILFTLNTAGGATKTFPSLTTLDNDAGDLLIAIAVLYDGNSTNAEFSAWGGGFTELPVGGDQAGTATMAIGIAYKFSDGTETGTFTVTTADTSANDSVMILMAIPAAHPVTPPEAGTMAVGTSPNSGSLNPGGWGTEDTLWIAVGGSGEDALTGSFTGVGTPPTNYTGEAQSGITADAIGGVEASVAFRQLNAASEDPGAWAMDTSNARGASQLIAVRGIPVHDLSIPDDLGLGIVTALTRETFISAPTTPLNDTVTALIRETFLSIPDDLGLLIVTNLDPPTGGAVEYFISADMPLGLVIDSALLRETFLSVPDDLGLGIASALLRETFVSVPDDLGLAVATSLFRETFLSVPDDLGLLIVSNIIVEGGVVEHFISADMPLSLVVDSALLRQTFISADDPLGIQIATALVRQTFISAAENYGPAIASALIQQMFLSIPDDLGLLIYSNLTVSTPGTGGGTSKYRTLLGAG